MTTDYFNRIIRKINASYHILIFNIISFIEKFYLYSIGISVQEKCYFKGWCSFFRHDDSFISIGANCRFNSSGYSNHIGLNHRCIIATMSPESSIKIGNGLGISGGSIISWLRIVIGNNVRIGANCVIMDSDFHLDDPRTPAPKEIRIGDNVWLGANVVVMKGVEIGENSIIGMNSIVTKNIPANCIAAGNPCKVIRKIATDN